MKRLFGREVHDWLRTGEVVGPASGFGPPSVRRGPAFPNEWFVDGQNGSDTADGRDPASPLKTILKVLTKIRSGDVIYLTGNFAEEAGDTPAAVEDVTVIGLGNRPRHADAARDALANPFAQTNQNSGCSWRPPAVETGTTPLITVVGQGWTFENILFVPPTDAAAIILERDSGSGNAEHDGSHATIRGCRFVGGHAGIDDVGGSHHNLIEDCRFEVLTDGIRTVNTAIAIPLRWVIRGCYFSENTNHIMVSASKWFIHDNFFDEAATFGIDLVNVSDQGSLNVITRNYLSGDYSTAEYKFDTTDEAQGNYSMDTAEAEVGAEGFTIAVPVA